MFTPEIKTFPNPLLLAIDAAERITVAANQAIAQSGLFSLVLSGGSTPKIVYDRLADEFRERIDWSRVEIYFGDERCVPPDHEQSNFRMANNSLLSKVPIPAENIHRMRGEIDPQQAATEYGQLLKEKFADGGPDLIMLGMGPDGHTASLFPHSEALNETKHRCVANFAPELKVWRITMSAPFINRAQNVLVLVAGADKADRVAEVLEGPRDPQRLPIQLISPLQGHMTWLLDAPAAGM